MLFRFIEPFLDRLLSAPKPISGFLVTPIKLMNVIYYEYFIRSRSEMDVRCILLRDEELLRNRRRIEPQIIIHQCDKCYQWYWSDEEAYRHYKETGHSEFTERDRPELLQRNTDENIIAALGE